MSHSASELDVADSFVDNIMSPEYVQDTNDIDRNKLAAESSCFLDDIAVILIHPIEVVASTPSSASMSSVVDLSVDSRASIVMSFGMPTMHHTDRLTFLALPYLSAQSVPLYRCPDGSGLIVQCTNPSSLATAQTIVTHTTVRFRGEPSLEYHV